MSNTTPNPLALPSDIATLVIGIIGVITNGILLTVLLLDPLKCFRRPSMYFVISLAFSDFLTCIVSCAFPFRMKVPSEYFTLISISAIWASVENSFLTILLMAIERLIVIRVPMKAKSIITRRRTWIAIAITWLISLLLGAGVSIPPPYGDYVMFCVLIELFVIILVMLIIYVIMLILIKKSSNIFRGKQFTRHSSSGSEKKPKEAKQEHNLTMVVFYLALVLVVTVLPHLIIGQIFVGNKLFNPGQKQTKALSYAPYISFPVELLNFVLNSVIYAYRLPQFRDSLRYYLKKITRKRQRPVSILNPMHQEKSFGGCLGTDQEKMV